MLCEQRESSLWCAMRTKTVQLKKLINKNKISPIFGQAALQWCKLAETPQWINQRRGFCLKRKEKKKSRMEEERGSGCEKETNAAMLFVPSRYWAIYGHICVAEIEIMSIFYQFSIMWK